MDFLQRNEIEDNEPQAPVPSPPVEGRSPLAQLTLRAWRNGHMESAQEAVWVRCYAALLVGCSGPADVERAAHLADAAYGHLTSRRNLQTQG